MINKLYLAITDFEWVNFLKDNQGEIGDCINFWLPKAKSFKILDKGDMFLFKLHSNQHSKGNGEIVGGGYFEKFENIKIDEAWNKYGIGNGTSSKKELKERIKNLRKGEKTDSEDVGCIILKNPFFFNENQYLQGPANWKTHTVQGKHYLVEDEEGKAIYDSVIARLSDIDKQCDHFIEEIEEDLNTKNCVGEEKEALVKVRVNQGPFRKKLTNRYNKCCLCDISNERFLTASHIKPWAKSDENEKLDIDNGFLLCKNHDVLFDKGYISFDDNGKIIISSKLLSNDIETMNINEEMRINLTEGNKKYLKFHRDNILKI